MVQSACARVGRKSSGYSIFCILLNILDLKIYIYTYMINMLTYFNIVSHPIKLQGKVRELQMVITTHMISSSNKSMDG